MKKKLLSVGLTFLLVISLSTPVFAETVYYKGDAVSWHHGVDWKRVCFSEVMTGEYEHSATANETFSGWQEPGVLTEARQFVGKDTAYAYWNCRG